MKHYHTKMIVCLWLSWAVLMQLPAIAQSGYRTASNKTLYQEGKQRLTEGQYEWSRFLIEFLLGANLDKADNQWVQQEIIKEFKKNPKSSRQNVQQARQIMQQINALQSPLELGLVRSYLLGSLYPVRDSEDAKDLFRLMEKYNPIVHYDAENSLAITRADLLSTWQVMHWNSSTQPLPTGLPAGTETNAIISQLLDQYKKADLNEKKLIASMQYQWMMLQLAMQQMSEEQQQALRQQQGQQPPASTPPVYSDLQQLERDRMIQQVILEKSASMSRYILGGQVEQKYVIETMGNGTMKYYYR